MNYNILIGGSAGQGMDTMATLFELILKRKGYYVFSNKDYMSRVRGGHNFIQIRFGTEEVLSHHPELDVIVAMDNNTIILHQERIKEGGITLTDKVIVDKIENPDEFLIGVEAIRIAKEFKLPKGVGTVFLGGVLKLFGIELDETVYNVLSEKLNKDLYENNKLMLEAGFENLDQKYQIEKGNLKDSLIINGNQALALGALAGGVSFYSAYPMTPSTSVMTYLSSKQRDAGIIVEQAEDEIAAINMAIGASYAGARAMTGTSGGGYSLMTEALGLAGITETPLVVINVQRPGPATGLPTRTEQSDLSFILTASHGEMPRMVMAVKDPEHAFYAMQRALNIADKYQILVNVLNDQYLADYNKTISNLDFSRIPIERHIAQNEEVNLDYKRYEVTENGVSKRVIPGQVRGITVMADSDEHDEYGHITESDVVRINQMDKRSRKLEYLSMELEEPEFIGVEKAENLIIGWGSTYGAIKETVNKLKSEGMSVGALIFTDIYPLPTKNLMKYSKDAKNIINVEQNSTGQLAKFIRQETGIYCNKSILKYDGRQINPVEIYEEVKKGVN